MRRGRPPGQLSTTRALLAPPTLRRNLHLLADRSPDIPHRDPLFQRCGASQAAQGGQGLVLGQHPPPRRAELVVHESPEIRESHPSSQTCAAMASCTRPQSCARLKNAMDADPDPLSGFSPATTRWFRETFAAHTSVQTQAWSAIRTGTHTLVIAPTGSGKTLSAFLWSLDDLQRNPPRHDSTRQCRVLYVSPLKALAADIERNLRVPLTGIGQHSEKLGLPRADVRVCVRSGDTPGSERRAFVKKGADVLITTPESLFLLLTSQARDRLRGVSTVIIDEIHAVAGTKRGAHLALTLERLDALLETPAQRIGLSATARPAEEVGRFLAGDRPVRIICSEERKRWDLSIVVPVPRLSDPGEPGPDQVTSGPADPRRTSVWPHVENRLVELIAAHRSTIVFTNSRRQAERLTARINELGEDQADVASELPPAGCTRSPPPPTSPVARLRSLLGHIMDRSAKSFAQPSKPT